jgi:hypothetical protein
MVHREQFQPFEPPMRLDDLEEGADAPGLRLGQRRYHGPQVLGAYPHVAIADDEDVMPGVAKSAQ